MNITKPISYRYHAEKGITVKGIILRGSTQGRITQRGNAQKGITQRANMQKGITQKGNAKIKGNLQKRAIFLEFDLCLF